MVTFGPVTCGAHAIQRRKRTGERLRVGVAALARHLLHRQCGVGQVTRGPREPQAAHSVGNALAIQRLVDAVPVEGRQMRHFGQLVQVQLFGQVVVDVGGDAAQALLVVGPAMAFVHAFMRGDLLH